MMDVDIAADKAAPQQQQQHVWSSAATAYEALALVLAALEDPSSSSSLTRSSLAALHATLHSAADAYLSHLVPPTSSRHQRLIHERSRFHVSRTQMTNTLAQGFQLPLRGSKDIGPSAVTSSTTAAATAPASGTVSKSSDQITILRALSQQLYSALNQLHPSRPAQPPDPDPPASTTAAAAAAAADTISSAAPPSNLSLPIDPTPPAPSPRTSPALATLALTSLSNILTAPARSLYSFEVFAEHFDLDRASAGGTGGAAGAASPAGGGVTSPSVAVSPAVMPPETADGGRAVSVIMIGGTVLVVDIEVGIKDVQQLGGAARTAAQQQQQEQEGAAWLPAWAKEKGQLSWLPSVHVKITFATDTSSSSSSSLSAVKTEVANGQSEKESGPAHTSDPAALAKLLQRHIEVLAELLLLGFPLNLELDPRRQSSSTANDDDVVMSDAADVPPTPVESQPASTNSSTRHEKSSNLLHTALRSEANARTRTPQQLDPSLRKTHMGLYGEEYYLLAHHHLQAFILLLGRLAQLDKERAGAGSAVASAA
ncbi:hypothetical protein OC846_004933 [Tilletia horrida]|uniref:Uncharacterized protein n=1 Tax=Tilletia horrida TaxID=155126 RepID=A0AAN6GM80_9BASI|nr:hypothetical protein OC846_004933 [Tilletia horrida]KAK0564603.1 hypothetical protein OC861_004193 [Tilletia horrida]